MSLNFKIVLMFAIRWYTEVSDRAWPWTEAGRVLNSSLLFTGIPGSFLLALLTRFKCKLMDIFEQDISNMT